MMHNGSKETLDFIADWYDSPIPFSKKDGWGRFGILAVLGDLVLYSVQGDIFEIGVGESSIYLTKLSQKHNRCIIHCDIAASKIVNPMTVPGYLTDGLTYVTPQSSDTSFKHCLAYAGSSDEFFKQIKLTPIALGFIDGDHLYEQVKKDFWNLIPYIVDDGVIFLHDTYPANENDLSENRCGTVYKLRQEIEKCNEFDCFTFTKIVAMGVGITMVRKKKSNRPWFQI